jgi:hypothetical protein
MTKICSKIFPKYYCKKCDYKCCKKSQWSQHLKTKKHNDDNDDKNDDKKYAFFCKCGKRYKYRQGLSVHKKKCKYIFDTTQSQSYENKELMDNDKSIDIDKSNVNGTLEKMFISLIEQNKELQNVIIEQNNKIMKMSEEPKTIINQNNNFNILQYLNSECKDAMNLTDFVKQLKLTFDDLIDLKENGLLINFRKTFVKLLNDMEQNKRPIHCSDKKRKKFYVKDEDKWNKDDKYLKINNAINRVSLKHCETLKNWKEKHPDWLSNDNKQENVNKITTQLSKVYDEKERIKIINELSQFKIDKN